jgi:hypothetical protein
LSTVDYGCHLLELGQHRICKLAAILPAPDPVGVDADDCPNGGQEITSADLGGLACALVTLKKGVDVCAEVAGGQCCCNTPSGPVSPPPPGSLPSPPPTSPAVNPPQPNTPAAASPPPGAPAASPPPPGTVTTPPPPSGINA